MDAKVRRSERFQQIVMCYVRALNGRWPEQCNLGDVLQAISEVVPDVTATELREAVSWSLRESRREGARIEAAMLRERRAMSDNIIKFEEMSRRRER